MPNLISGLSKGMRETFKARQNWPNSHKKKWMQSISHWEYQIHITRELFRSCLSWEYILIWLIFPLSFFSIPISTSLCSSPSCLPFPLWILKISTRYPEALISSRLHFHGRNPVMPGLREEQHYFVWLERWQTLRVFNMLWPQMRPNTHVFT